LLPERSVEFRIELQPCTQQFLFRLID
jgi:hypothetical protein